jgi:hypothetical protein
MRGIAPLPIWIMGWCVRLLLRQSRRPSQGRISMPRAASSTPAASAVSPPCSASASTCAPADSALGTAAIPASHNPKREGRCVHANSDAVDVECNYLGRARLYTRSLGVVAVLRIALRRRWRPDRCIPQSRRRDSRASAASAICGRRAAVRRCWRSMRFVCAVRAFVKRSASPRHQSGQRTTFCSRRNDSERMREKPSPARASS